MTSNFLTIETEHYSVTIDHLRHIVQVRCRGLWDMTIANDYVRAMRAARDNRPPDASAQAMAILVDMTQFVVQTQDVVAVMKQFISEFSMGHERRAIVLNSSLLKLQALRTASGYRIFEDYDEALKWLIDGD